MEHRSLSSGKKGARPGRVEEAGIKFRPPMKVAEFTFRPKKREERDFHFWKQGRATPQQSRAGRTRAELHAGVYWPEDGFPATKIRSWRLHQPDDKTGRLNE